MCANVRLVPLIDLSKSDNLLRYNNIGSRSHVVEHLRRIRLDATAPLKRVFYFSVVWDTYN